VTALVLEAASRRVRDGAGERVALDSVSLEIEAGEVVGVWGKRRSGRSTLIRVAAGVEEPDSGVVRVDGQDLWQRGRRHRDEARAKVAMWYPRFLRDHGRWTDRQVAMPARRGRRGRRRTLAEAREALARVGIAECAQSRIGELDHRETVRAALARALMVRPTVLVLDDPTSGLEPLDRESFLAVILAIAREDRIAVLLTASDPAQLGGVDRHLSISAGVLRGATKAEPATVVPLRRTEPGG
jgi:ABC-type methionine transport system ATPase subunit